MRISAHHVMNEVAADEPRSPSDQQFHVPAHPS
jgi:hypothetical protein